MGQNDECLMFSSGSSNILIPNMNIVWKYKLLLYA